MAHQVGAHRRPSSPSRVFPVEALAATAGVVVAVVVFVLGAPALQGTAVSDGVHLFGRITPSAAPTAPVTADPPPPVVQTVTVPPVSVRVHVGGRVEDCPLTYRSAGVYSCETG